MSCRKNRCISVWSGSTYIYLYLYVHNMYTYLCKITRVYHNSVHIHSAYSCRMHEHIEITTGNTQYTQCTQYTQDASAHYCHCRSTSPKEWSGRHLQSELNGVEQSGTGTYAPRYDRTMTLAEHAWGRVRLQSPKIGTDIVLAML